jgi:hypothetical protein
MPLGFRRSFLPHTATDPNAILNAFTLKDTTAPEPASLALTGCAMGGLLLIRRRATASRGMR